MDVRTFRVRKQPTTNKAIQGPDFLCGGWQKKRNQLCKPVWLKHCAQQDTVWCSCGPPVCSPCFQVFSTSSPPNHIRLLGLQSRLGGKCPTKLPLTHKKAKLPILKWLIIFFMTSKKKKRWGGWGGGVGRLKRYRQQRVRIEDNKP